MAYPSLTNDVEHIDFTERVVYYSANHMQAAAVTALRRPMSHSQARALQQWVTFDDADVVFHLNAADMPNIPTVGTSDFLIAADGRYYSPIVYEFQAAGTRILIVGRQVAPSGGAEDVLVHLELNETAGALAYDRGQNTTYPLQGLAADGVSAFTFDNSCMPLGKLGKALCFPHTASRINLGSAAALDDITPLSVAFWFREQSTSADPHRIFDFGTLRLDYDDNAEKLTLTQDFGTTDGIWTIDLPTLYDGPPDASDWRHLVILYARSAAADNPVIYVNGVSQPVTEVQSPVGLISTDAAGDKILGANTAGFVTGYDLDDIRIYGRALSALEASLFYLLNPND